MAAKGQVFKAPCKSEDDNPWSSIKAFQPLPPRDSTQVAKQEVAMLSPMPTWAVPQASHSSPTGETPHDHLERAREQGIIALLAG